MTTNERMAPRVAFVVHQYGPDLGGGLERLCQIVAERMSGRWNVEVLTTCSRDFSTWRNEYAPGATRLNDVSILRFPVAEERDPESFRRRCDHILFQDHTRQDEEEWMRAQGPYSPELFQHIETHFQAYDLFVFFGYVYATTYFGITQARSKAVLVPAAHDEPMIRLGIYREVFAASDYTLFLTLEERRLVEKVCAKPSAGEIGGLGWELPALKPRDARQPTDPYLLYVGRVDHPKGCGELLEFFRHRPPELADLRLLLVGRVMMETRLDPNVHALGYVEEEEKDQLLEGALALVMPSPYESLSLVLLESWARGIPVIANGRCQALRGQCERSDGGLVYNDLGSFQRAVRALFDDPPLRLLLGLRGRRYVRRVYSWEKAEQCYERALEAVSRENRRLPAA